MATRTLSGLCSSTAHTDLVDKHGVTHEMLVRENGKQGMVEMLKEWLAYKNGDLGEHEGDVGSWGGTERRTTSTGVLNCLEYTVRKRLHVKRSIDHALNSRDTRTQIAIHICEYTFYPTSASRPDFYTNDKPSSRQLSLPHIYDGLQMPSIFWRP
ncbi:hypothetical protein PILCRDRAFT_14205 [Piloderma croceum F 1598]|uniref:Uncharacterized protein n=1 Tax=Piloderma croceum (strain F 1598) TaxID=765440 RepID=A0A0C3F402_PILCF|nr:hypothetical protein PILCRDRAFT_14205 [Piloderma croceum F 1598]